MPGEREVSILPPLTWHLFHFTLFTFHFARLFHGSPLTDLDLFPSNQSFDNSAQLPSFS